MITVAKLEFFPEVLEICRLVADNGGRALVVGGAVRDALLGSGSGDCDLEVYRIPQRKLQDLLAGHYSLDLVGRDFGVIKLRKIPIDISIPRRESKCGTGHRGFEIMSQAAMPVEAAAARRDFTINAMAYDPLRGELIDPFRGKHDLAARVLRHTSDKFGEDPLRVLRGMQFIARLELKPAPETVSICASITPEGLARERIFGEWRKMLLEGIRPSAGLRFLENCNWLRYYPELKALAEIPRDAGCRSEDNPWEHTLQAMDIFAGRRSGEAREDLVVGLAVLCHELGKPANITEIGSRKGSPENHRESGGPTRRLLRRLTGEREMVREVEVLVREHMRPLELYRARAEDRAIRRLAVQVGRMDRLARVAEADLCAGGAADANDCPECEWLLQQARRLQVHDSAPEPLVKGRHLVAMGMKPGPAFSEILAACYDQQIDGRIATLKEGLDLAREMNGRRS